ncbi:preprotein translocase subunit YajC [Intestinimonas sp.]|nr:preprotein translocase subunit YajC [Intestinimonas sp.]
MLVVMLAIFYFLLIRPENKKKKELAKMRSELTIGDEVTTIGGIIGTICAVKEESIVLETGADRVRVEFAKWAISTKGAQTTETTK